MIDKKFFFLCGLPRAGSTVLASILNQNPEIYCTPTSPLLDLLEYNDYGWNNCPSVIANPIQGKNIDISQAIINGCWEHIEKPIIIDKCRGWVNHVPTIKTVFNQTPKILINVRNLTEILASYIKILREQPEPTYIDKIVIEKGYILNDSSRVEVIWEIHIKPVMQWLENAIRFYKDSLLLIEYDDLVDNKEETIKSIYNFLEIPKFDHYFDNIKNVTVEKDEEAWSVKDLHKVNAKLEKVAKHPKDILGEEIYDKYNRMNLEFWRNHEN